MVNLTFKVYKNNNYDLVYTTLNIDNAVRKYFIYIRENPTIEIWKGNKLIGRYNQNIYDLKSIKHDLEILVKAA